MNRDLIPRIEPLVEQLNVWRGSLVEVVEQITRSPGTLDRHFTTRSAFVMRLEFASVAFSGANLMLMGKAGDQNADYQVTCDLLEDLSIGPAEIVLVERFGKAVERHSTLKLLKVDSQA